MMNRRFWVVMMLLSAGLLVVALVLFNQRIPRDEGTAVALEPVAVVPEAPVAPTPAITPEGEPAPAETPPLPGAEATPALAPEKTEKPLAARPVSGTPPAIISSAKGGKKNVRFTYEDDDAETVFIVGEFNNWYRQPLKKNKGKWQITLAMKPGVYRYLFIVRGKRVLDPANEKLSDDGKSLVTVGPVPSSSQRQ